MPNIIKTWLSLLIQRLAKKSGACLIVQCLVASQPKFYTVTMISGAIDEKPALSKDVALPSARRDI